jgi:sulfite reductase beta subunit-like hemoprotein
MSIATCSQPKLPSCGLCAVADKTVYDVYLNDKSIAKNKIKCIF